MISYSAIKIRMVCLICYDMQLLNYARKFMLVQLTLVTSVRCDSCALANIYNSCT